MVLDNKLIGVTQILYFQVSLLKIFREMNVLSTSFAKKSSKYIAFTKFYLKKCAIWHFGHFRGSEIDF